MIGNFIHEKLSGTNTGIAVSTILKDIRRISLTFNISTFFIALAALLIRLFKGDFIVANSVLLASLLVCTVLKIAFKDDKKATKVVKLVQRGIKIVASIPILLVTVMAFYTSTSEPDVISIFLAVLLLLIWTLEVLFEIITIYISERYDLVKEAIALDLKSLEFNPKNIVSGILGKNSTDEDTKSDMPKENRHRKILRRKKARLDAERKQKKAEEKEEKKRAKLATKETKKAEKAAKKAEKAAKKGE